MSSEFNAYSSWLGIPEDEQPPHYYRLLGLEPFESDPNVIRQAGQRVVGIVKSREKGELGTAARRLKAEVTFAAACLLDEKKKAQYDRELDAWFNEYDSSSGSGDDYELEEPDLPMAKIVQRSGDKSAAKSKSGSSKAKSGSSVKSSGSKTASGKGKSKSTKADAKPAAAKKPMNVGLIAGLAVAIVAILGLGGGLAYVFLKPAKPVVAKVDAKAAPGAVDPDEEEEETPKKTDKKPAVDEDEEEEEAATKKTTEDEDDTAKTAAAAPGEKDPAEKTEPVKVETPAADPSKTTTPAPDATGAKPPETTPTTPATGETPAPMPMPMTTPATPATEKPAEPAKPEPPADPKLEDPFREVGTALELPVFVDAATSTTPAVIAKVYPKEGERVNAKLLAGNAVLAKLGEFTLSGGSLTDAEPKWTIKFVDRQGKTTPIANLTYKANEFTFAWTGEGEAEKNNVLQNCLLQITAGFSNRRLPLRKPLEIEPLSVVMEPKGTVLEIPIVGLPEDRETVIMEITKLVGGFPADPTYDPGQQIKPGETVQIMFAKLDLAFKGIFLEERGGGLKLDFRPMIRGPKPRNNGPRPLKPYAIKPPIEQQITYAQGMLVQGTANFDAFKTKNAANKEVMEQAELNFQQATSKLNDQVKQLTDLKLAIDTLAKEGKVQFRIFMRVGDAADGFSVELVKTKDYSPAEPAKK